MTGRFCMVLLEMDESVEFKVSRLDSRARCMLPPAPKPSRRGEILPGCVEVVLGGRSGPSNSPLSDLCIKDRLLGCLVTASSSDCVRVVSLLLLLATLACLLDPPPDGALFCRNLDCFFFKPCSRLIMMSLIRGKNRSKLAWDASWLNVSSNIDLKRSGTGPRSLVSTPILLKALHAMLNSYPSRTYTSDTSASVDAPRDHMVRVSRSCLVATSRCVTLFSI